MTPESGSLCIGWAWTGSRLPLSTFLFLSPSAPKPPQFGLYSPWAELGSVGRLAETLAENLGLISSSGRLWVFLVCVHVCPVSVHVCGVCPVGMHVWCEGECENELED